MMRRGGGRRGTADRGDRGRVRGRRRARSSGASRRRGCPALVERTGIAGALVDTFVKDGRGLYAWLLGARAGRSGRSHAPGGRDLRAWPDSCAGASCAGWPPTSSACDRPSAVAATGPASWRPSWWRPRWPELRAGGTDQPGDDPRSHRARGAGSPHHDRHAGAAHGLRQVGGRRRVPPPACCSACQLAGGQVARSGASSDGQRAEHPGDRLEQDRLLGADGAGRQHRQRVTRDRPGLGYARRGPRTPAPPRACPARAVRRGRSSGSAAGSSDRQHHAELIHRL